MEFGKKLTILGEVMILSSKIMMLSVGLNFNYYNNNMISSIAADENDISSTSSLPNKDLTLDMISVSEIDDHLTYGTTVSN